VVSAARATFCSADERFRHLLVDWAEEARRLPAQYRAAAGRYAGGPRFRSLTATLCAASAEFRTWWEQHDIAGFPVPADSSRLE